MGFVIGGLSAVRLVRGRPPILGISPTADAAVEESRRRGETSFRYIFPAEATVPNWLRNTKSSVVRATLQLLLESRRIARRHSRTIPPRPFE